MALNSSGPISLGGATAGQSINLENGNSATATVSLNDAAVRSLAGVPSGTIIMPTNFYGKSNAFAATISSNQTNLNLRTWALANGWNGSSAANITVAAGVYIYATSTGNAGLTTGSFPGGLTIVNNGYIIGMGGAGGSNAAGGAGGIAITLNVNTSITNNGYIAGGGGGGGTGGGDPTGAGGGGGAGGGNGANGKLSGYTLAGGTGGGPGAAGTNGVGGWNEAKYGGYTFSGGGGGGGRILPGTGGAAQPNSPDTTGGRGGGAGGGGGCYYNAGAGGSGGSAGGNGNAAGGGGWGSSGGSDYRSGGAGGKAINLNGYTATRTGSGTTYGAVS